MTGKIAHVGVPSGVHGRGPLVCVVSLWFCASSALGMAAEVHVNASRHGDSFEVDATALIQVDVADAWKVVTDYDHLTEFIPGLQESKVVSRKGFNVVVDQIGEARMLFFKFPMRVRLAITEFPNGRIVADAIAGNFKQMHGIYRFEAREKGMQLRYEGSFTPDFEFPPFIGTLVVRRNLEKRFVAMVREIEKRRNGESLPGKK
ncbi:MAG TPA: SRPBCC family protein [Terriglobales bacterium]